MHRKVIIAIAILLTTAATGMACVGKSLVVGTDGTQRSKAAAQIMAILINERTGTTVEISDYEGYDGLFKEMTQGDVDIALMYVGQALAKDGQKAPDNPSAAFEQVKSYQQEKHNLVWLTDLGFLEAGNPNSLAVAVAQKHTIKKFPALPRLIAKTQGKLDEKAIQSISASPNISKAARDYLKLMKLI